MTGPGSAGADVDIDGLLARCRFPSPGTAVACGLSGGPDSSALVALAAAAGLKVTAWHVNHGLRASAEADETAACALAAQFGARFIVRSVSVPPGPNLEARARSARYDALPDDVMVGHTADDRAETVLFNIGRGAGLAGASARYERVLRPLLALRRWETHAVCSQLGLEVVTDPMNSDERFARVAIRKHVIPALAQALRRDPVPLLNRHADLAAEAHDAFTTLARRLDPTSTEDLLRASRPVAAEALRAWIAVSTGQRATTAASVARVLDVAAGGAKAAEITGGYRVARTRGRLRIEPPAR